MPASSRHADFIRFRTEFPFFCFEKQEFVLDTKGLHVQYHFNISDRFQFTPTLFFPRKSFFRPDSELIQGLAEALFYLGMVELISYWKLTCSPLIVIRPYSLETAQVEWYKKLWFNGLGEFFHLNGIATDRDGFAVVQASEGRPLQPTGIKMGDGILIPVGGGKDSAVTLELLGRHEGAIPLIMNPRNASLETIRTAGFDDAGYVEIHRTLDPLMLRLNREGFLNGHTPFSALLAFVTCVSAILTGANSVALSNESSANEPTIGGTGINHQYSKSFEFERDFREFTRSWISSDFNYFSFLRPLNELQIASLFSRYTRYHRVFRSCNAGSKTDSWCGKCAKCLFTFIMLSPFLGTGKVSALFGRNLFTDEDLGEYFDQLTGQAAEKPFDCVGTIREVNIALCETIRLEGKATLPILLERYRNSETFGRYSGISSDVFMQEFHDDHFVPDQWLALLRKEMSC